MRRLLIYSCLIWLGDVDFRRRHIRRIFVLYVAKREGKPIDETKQVEATELAEEEEELINRMKTVENFV